MPVVKPTLILMLKEPHPGRVKTRLGREIGMVAAAWWFRHQPGRLIRHLRDPQWNMWLAVSPDHEGLQSRVWPADLPRVTQGRGDLGQRMARVMQKAPGPACVIGGDIPGIEKRHIRQAFALLGSHMAVFGPAPDGGYWLVGLKRAQPWPAGFFDNVRWSTASALADSVQSLGNRSVAYADTLADVDTAADLAMTRRGRRAS